MKDACHQRIGILILSLNVIYLFSEHFLPPYLEFCHSPYLQSILLMAWHRDEVQRQQSPWFLLGPLSSACLCLLGKSRSGNNKQEERYRSIG